MHEEREARYLAELRAELEPVDWLVFRRAEPGKRKSVNSATRFEALMDVAKRNHLEIEMLDAEVRR